ncbi:Transducin beta-like protein 3 [Thelohanellus kitauei]|uniref:Transducin beta-like protein 3 n=1 Tax=Thelohanellus kitauei TaxID=669202 RepID=A0A0C2MGN8_THEKT|nr:Transducin beta-like protein 3 [Thelohanellus kitauei]
MQEHSFGSKNFIRFEKQSENKPISSSGNILVSSPENVLFVLRDNEVNIIESDSLKFIESLSSDDSKISAFSVDDELLITASENKYVHVWNLENHAVCQTWKSGHKHPITHISSTRSLNVVATASSDCIRLYDLNRRAYMHNLKGPKGPVSCLSFIKSKPNLIFSSCDNVLRVWDVKSGKLEKELCDHTSLIISAISLGDRLYTLGRDKTINVYDLSNFKKIASLILFEDVECMLIVPNASSSNIHDIYTFGTSGNLKLWSHSPAKCLKEFMISSLSNNSDKMLQRSVVQGMHYLSKSHSILISTYLSDLVYFDIEREETTKHSSLNLNQVFCVDFIKNWIAVASDSSIIRVFDYTCKQNILTLEGHDDIVICLNYRDGILASGGKDEQLVIWSVDEFPSIQKRCQVSGHIATITCVCVSHS